MSEHKKFNTEENDIAPDQVLQAAMGKLDSVIIIGYDNNEYEYFATSLKDGGDMLWLVERFKSILLDVRK